MLGPRVGICLGLTCNANLLSKVLSKVMHSVHSPQSRGEFPLLQASSTLGIVLVFSFQLSSGCEMVSPGFNFDFRDY